MSNRLENLVRLLNLALTHQPEGTLVDEEAADEENAGGYKLESHRDPPTGR